MSKNEYKAIHKDNYIFKSIDFFLSSNVCSI